MLRPLLNKSSEDDEIDKIGMHVDDSIRGLGVDIKLMELVSYVCFDIIAIVRFVFTGVVVKQIGCGLVGVLKDAHVGDA